VKSGEEGGRGREEEKGKRKTRGEKGEE